MTDRPPRTGMRMAPAARAAMEIPHIASVHTLRCVGGPHDGTRLVQRPDRGPVHAPGGCYVPTVLGDETVFAWEPEGTG